MKKILLNTAYIAMFFIFPAQADYTQTCGTASCTYNDDNQLIKKEYESYTDTYTYENNVKTQFVREFTTGVTIEYSIGSNGYISGYRYYSPNTKYTEINNTTRDENGKVVTSQGQGFIQGGDAYTDFTIHYNNGVLNDRTDITYDLDGNTLHTIKYDYDSDGDKLLVTKYDANGNIVSTQNYAKKIYTLEEAYSATKKGNVNSFKVRYR